MRDKPERRINCRHRSPELANADSSLQFQMRPLKDGVGVEWTRRIEQRSRVHGWYIVDDAQQFQSGCDADELRHHDPRLHQALKQEYQRVRELAPSASHEPEAHTPGPVEPPGTLQDGSASSCRKPLWPARWHSPVRFGVWRTFSSLRARHARLTCPPPAVPT
jgi:hypothetical protein